MSATTDGIEGAFSVVKGGIAPLMKASLLMVNQQTTMLLLLTFVLLVLYDLKCLMQNTLFPVQISPLHYVTHTIC